MGIAYPAFFASWIVTWPLPFVSTADTSPPAVSVGAANVAIPELPEGELSSLVSPCAALYSSGLIFWNSSTTWYPLIVYAYL